MMKHLLRHTWLKGLTTLLFYLMISSQVNAQIPAANYSFSADIGTFMPLAGGTGITDLQDDDYISSSLPIGFTFRFCGEPYTSFQLGTNGWLSFRNNLDQNGSSYLTNNYASSASVNPALFPLWDDLSGVGATAHYQLSGTAPNQVLTIEYLNWRWNYASEPTISFQIKLYETSNVIEYIYRQEADPGAPGGSSGATIGIVDHLSTRTYLTLNNSSASPTASSATFTTTITSRPATGQIYRFTPPPSCNTITGLPTSGSISTSGNAICYNSNLTLTATHGTSAPIASDLAYQWEFSATGAAPWTTLATNATNTYTLPVTQDGYYRYIFLCGATVLYESDPSAIVTVNNPQPATVTGATRCGVGTVQLSATAASGTLNWYAAASGGTSLGTGANFTTPTIGATTTFYVGVTTTGPTCAGQRVPVVATVTAPPTLSTTDSLVICYGAIVPLTVTSNITDFDNYVWSPSTNLYTDAGGTIAYTGGSQATVYFKSATSNNYSVKLTATNTGTSCSNVDSTYIKVLPTSTTIDKSMSAICGSGASTLSVPNAVFLNNNIQWQNASSAGGPYTDIPAANTRSYTTPVLSTTGYYQVLVKDYNNNICLQQTDSVNIHNPVAPAAADVSRCGTGTVTLNASSPQTTTGFYWYTSATATNAAGQGATFTTPMLTTTTSYWVGTRFLTESYTAKPAPSGTLPASSGWSGLKFNVSIPFTLKSVDVYPRGNGEFYIDIYDADYNLVTGTSAVNYTNGDGATPLTVPLNFAIPTGTYYILCDQWSGNLSGPEASWTAPFPLMSNSLQIGDIESGFDAYLEEVPEYYFLYNWKVEGPCESNRIQVNAVINTAPAINASASATTICNGSSTTLTVGSGNTDYTYTWMPGNLPGNNVTVSPAYTTTYTVTAIDNSAGPNAGCQAIATIPITVNPSPGIPEVSPLSPRSTCIGESINLLANSTSGGDLIADNFESGSAPGFRVTGTDIAATVNMDYYYQGSSAVHLTYGSGIGYTSNSSYEMVNAVNLTNASNPRLSFWHIAGIEGYANYDWDRGIIEYSTDGGTTWQGIPGSNYLGNGTLATGGMYDGNIQFTVDSYTDWYDNVEDIIYEPAPATSLWKQETIDLTPYIGVAQFKIRFKIKSDGSVIYYGWLIDSLKITSDLIDYPIAWSATPATHGLPTSALTPSLANTNVMAAPTAAGFYTYTATASLNGCSSSASTAVITVTAPFTVNATANGGTTLCSATGIELNANISGSGYTYQWYNDAVAITGATSQTYTATTAGNYYVVVSNGSCTVTSNTLPINISTPPVASFTASAGTIICQGDTSTLSASPNGSTYTYRWFKDGQIISVATAATYKAYVAGSYKVEVIENGCSDTSDAQTLTVTARPTPNIIANGPVLTTAGIYDDYQWYLNNAMIDGATNYIYNATVAGDYKVCVTVNGCTGCSETRYVDPGGQAVNDIDIDVIRIYPNPAHEIIYIDAPLTVNVSLRSIDGKEILRKERVTSLSLGHVVNGIYMLYITDSRDNLLKVQRIIKQAQ